jgi:hypothetical protein
MVLVTGNSSIFDMGVDAVGPFFGSDFAGRPGSNSLGIGLGVVGPLPWVVVGKRP